MLRCRTVREGDWSRQRGRELRGQRLGLVGLGAIGRKVALRALAFGMTVYARRDDRIYTFVMEAGNELSKVTWPNWPETRLATIVTVVVTIIIAMILEGFDYLWAALSSLVYNV